MVGESTSQATRYITYQRERSKHLGMSEAADASRPYHLPTPPGVARSGAYRTGSRDALCLPLLRRQCRLDLVEHRVRHVGGIDAVEAPPQLGEAPLAFVLRSCASPHAQPEK